MQVFKEIAPKHVVLRTNTYSHTLDHFDMLFNEAKKDFPSLDRRDVEVVQYGGKRYKGTFGIEFQYSIDWQIPDEYVEITQVELTK